MTDWYRTSDWSPAAQDDFERRLSRARSYNRAQYVRIKGHYLSQAGNVHAARELWQRIVDGRCGNDGERASALEHLADSYNRSNGARGEQLYRQLLTEYPDLNGTSHCAEMSLSEVLLRLNRFDEALHWLTLWKQRNATQWPSDLFRWAPELDPRRAGTRRPRSGALGLSDRGPIYARHQVRGSGPSQ